VKKIILIAGLMTMLSGCLSPQEIRQQQAQTCAGYGFKPGTSQFAQCMMAQAQKAERADACSGAYFRGVAQANPTDSFWIQQAAGGDAEAACMAGRPRPQPQRQPDPPPPNMMPKNTSCTSSGNAINCITY